ncbi:hypothetical protein DENSPDRAFT_330470 [Dentipellis sp. KUC8613]|nr:hypothetical protein DENSPDRAFT_330470 [Dentipellis sp. KUC8613]
MDPTPRSLFTHDMTTAMRSHPHLAKPITTNYLSPAERAARRRSDAKASYLLDVPIIRMDAGEYGYEYEYACTPDTLPTHEMRGRSSRLKRGLQKGISSLGIWKPVLSQSRRREIPRRAVLPTVFARHHGDRERSRSPRPLRRTRSDTFSRAAVPSKASSVAQQDGVAGVSGEVVFEKEKEKGQGAEAGSVSTNWVESLFGRYDLEGPEVMAVGRATPISSSGSEEQSTLVSPRLSLDTQVTQGSQGSGSPWNAEEEPCAV